MGKEMRRGEWKRKRKSFWFTKKKETFNNDSNLRLCIEKYERFELPQAISRFILLLILKVFFLLRHKILLL